MNKQIKEYDDRRWNVFETGDDHVSLQASFEYLEDAISWSIVEYGRGIEYISICERARE